MTHAHPELCLRIVWEMGGWHGLKASQRYHHQKLNRMEGFISAPHEHLAGV